MKTKLPLLLSAVCLTTIILLSACLNSRPKIYKTNPAFAKYISGFTSGMVSRKSTIRIELAHSVNEGKIAADSAIGSVTNGSINADSMAVWAATVLTTLPDSKIGRASCRERV